jgi:xanthine/CO dehydrogenase XdhC/CoxF family maturation factor
MTVKALLQSFAGWSKQNEPLVLATVVETEGSTYSKAGARMLIARDGVFQAMLSGGCLEGDLALRAEAVLSSGQPQAVTYDLGGNDDALWGLGVGCDGLMRVFLQPLLPQQGYQPFAAMAEVLSGDEAGMAATVIESPDPSLAAGATLVGPGRARFAFGIPEASGEPLARALEEAHAGRQSITRTLDLAGHAVKVLFARLLPPPRILVLGAGLDAEPLVRFADELGWRVTVQDHRPAYIAKGNFAAAERILCEPAERAAEALELDRYEAVIVMSHHLDTDRKYLAQLASSRIPYIGLLGPPNRRRRLLSELGAHAAALEHRLHGPAGFDIGGDGPASIALSIVAEMLADMKGRPG